MKPLFLFIIISLVFFSCNQKVTISKHDNLKLIKDSIGRVYTVDEGVIDSTSIGVKGKYKIDIQQIRYFEGGVYITYKLFEKVNSIWKMKQSFKMEKDGI